MMGKSRWRCLGSVYVYDLPHSIIVFNRVFSSSRIFIAVDIASSASSSSSSCLFLIRIIRRLFYFRSNQASSTHGLPFVSDRGGVFIQTFDVDDVLPNLRRNLDVRNQLNQVVNRVDRRMNGFEALNLLPNRVGIVDYRLKLRS